MNSEIQRYRDAIAMLNAADRDHTILGVPVRDVAADWKPVVAWWARKPDGSLTPVYRVSQ